VAVPGFISCACCSRSSAAPPPDISVANHYQHSHNPTWRRWAKKSPLRLGRQPPAPRDHSSPTHAPRGAIPMDSSAFVTGAWSLWDVQERNGPKFQRSFFVGNRLPDHPPSNPAVDAAGHRQPLVRDERRNRDDRAADRPTTRLERRPIRKAPSSDKSATRKEGPSTSRSVTPGQGGVMNSIKFEFLCRDRVPR